MLYAAYTFQFSHTDTFANERMYHACFGIRRIDILKGHWDSVYVWFRWDVDIIDWIPRAVRAYASQTLLSRSETSSFVSRPEYDILLH